MRSSRERGPTRRTLVAFGFALAAWRGGRPPVQGAEARAIAASKGVVSRHADTLVIRVQGHAPLRLVNGPDTPDSAATYTYAGPIPSTALHVVNVHYWETGDVLLVDGRSGDTIHMLDRPTVSPSGRFAVAAAYDMSGIGEGSNAIELWRLTPAPARVVWRRDMVQPDTVGDWGASIAGWTGDSIVRLVRHIVVAGSPGRHGDHAERREAARLVRVDTGWRLDTLPRGNRSVSPRPAR